VNPAPIAGEINTTVVPPVTPGRLLATCPSGAMSA
jgi:hypothetical protein